MTPAEVASPAPVYIVLALMLLACVIVADWTDDDSHDGP